MGTLSLHCALTTTPTRRRKLPHPLHYYPSLAPPGGRLSSSTSSDIEEKPGVMCVFVAGCFAELCEWSNCIYVIKDSA